LEGLFEPRMAEIRSDQRGAEAALSQSEFAHDALVLGG
jgi:hypothetical protein